MVTNTLLADTAHYSILLAVTATSFRVRSSIHNSILESINLLFIHNPSKISLKNPKTDELSWKALTDSVQEFWTDPKALRIEDLHWVGISSSQKSGYHYLMQIVRNRSLIEHLIRLQVRKRTKPKLFALLSLAVVQLLEYPDSTAKHAKIIHHTVDQTRKICSNNESKFANAVCRNVSRNLLENLKILEEREQWSILYSHPKWLIDRWVQQHGKGDTLEILKWNQRIPSTYLHDFTRTLASDISEEVEDNLAAMGLETTEWTDFYRVKKSDRSHIKSLLKDRYYIQDPSTRIPTSLFSFTNQEQNDTAESLRILDACSSPGGKLVHLYKHLCLKHEDNPELMPCEIFATDVSSDRIDYLKDNIERLKLESITISQADWETGAPDELSQNLFDFILIDAPCTSSGVIQKHPEIRWRLSSNDYEQIPGQQLNILKSCSRSLKTGGQMVYSTCSIDSSENNSIAESFLESEEGKCFKLLRNQVYLPHQHNHDGGGSVLFEKVQ